MPAAAEETIFSAKMKGDNDMSDIQLNEVIERYLNGEMTDEKQIRFEILREQKCRS